MVGNLYYETIYFISLNLVRRILLKFQNSHILRSQQFYPSQRYLDNMEQSFYEIILHLIVSNEGGMEVPKQEFWFVLIYHVGSEQSIYLTFMILQYVLMQQACCKCKICAINICVVISLQMVIVHVWQSLKNNFYLLLIFFSQNQFKPPLFKSNKRSC